MAIAYSEREREFTRSLKTDGKPGLCRIWL